MKVSLLLEDGEFSQFLIATVERVGTVATRGREVGLREVAVEPMVQKRASA